MSSGDSKITKLQSDFQALTVIAAELNTASDNFTKTVALLDEALKSLNIGLTVWVNFTSRGDDEEPQLYDVDQIGYCKVNGTWGLALRNIWGDETPPHMWERSEGPWLFTDGPRDMRLRSVDKIPDVIAELAREAADTTKNIQGKTKNVLELAEAITSLSDPTQLLARVAQKEAEKSRTLAERVAAGQKSLTHTYTLTGKLSDLSGEKRKERGK
jgi:hypothetical protein